MIGELYIVGSLLCKAAFFFFFFISQFNLHEKIEGNNKSINKLVGSSLPDSWARIFFGV